MEKEIDFIITILEQLSIIHNKNKSCFSYEFIKQPTTGEISIDMKYKTGQNVIVFDIPIDFSKDYFEPESYMEQLLIFDNRIENFRNILSE